MTSELITENSILCSICKKTREPKLTMNYRIYDHDKKKSGSKETTYCHDCVEFHKVLLELGSQMEGLV